jgi:hypothetical protein
VSSLVLGLASAASVNYVMFAITCTLMGLALSGFTIIVMPLGKALKGQTGLEGWREAFARVRWSIWLLLTLFRSPAWSWA